jgi:hypothetical protein
VNSGYKETLIIAEIDYSQIELQRWYYAPINILFISDPTFFLMKLRKYKCRKSLPLEKQMRGDIYQFVDKHEEQTP